MKSKLISYCLRFVLFLIRLIPKSLISVLAYCLGGIAPWLLKRDSRLIAGNINRVYNLPPHSNFSQAFQRQVFRSQIAVGLETLREQMAEKSLFTFAGYEEAKTEINRLLSADKGVIVVTAHLGSWEMNAKMTAQASGKTFHALAKPSKLPEFTKVLENLRGRGQTNVLWTDSKNILKDMIRVLKEGGCLGFVMDQKPEGRIGPVVDFLGQRTEFVSGPAKLAIRHRCPVFAVFCIRTGPWEYRIVFETIAEGGHEESDEVALTQRMATSIERIIRLYPEQWIWNYKRWRNQTASLN